MKILISGFNGFIGKNLSFKLSKNYQVFKFQKYKKTNKNFDLFIHCAGIAHKKKINYQNFKTNFNLTKKALEYCKINKIKYFVFMSSANVYGNYELNNRKFFKINEVSKKKNLYVKSKIYSEKFIMSFAKKNKINYVILRLPIVYGYGVKANFKSMIKFFLFSPILPIKSFINKKSICSVNNISDFIKYLMKKKKYFNQIYNIKDNKDLSIYEIAKIIINKKKLNKIFFNDKIIFLKFFFILFNRSLLYRKIKYPIRISIKETIEKTNWKPKYTFKNEIEKTIESIN